MQDDIIRNAPFDLSVSGRPPAASGGVGPPSLKTKPSSKTAKISLRERHCAPLTSCGDDMCADTNTDLEHLSTGEGRFRMVRDPSIVSPSLTVVFIGGGHNKHGT